MLYCERDQAPQLVDVKGLVEFCYEGQSSLSQSDTDKKWRDAAPLLVQEYVKPLHDIRCAQPPASHFAGTRSPSLLKRLEGWAPQNDSLADGG